MVKQRRVVDQHPHYNIVQHQHQHQYQHQHQHHHPQQEQQRSLQRLTQQPRSRSHDVLQVHPHPHTDVHAHPQGHPHHIGQQRRHQHSSTVEQPLLSYEGNVGSGRRQSRGSSNKMNNRTQSRKKTSQTEIALLVRKYLKQNNFSRTEQVFNEESSSVFGKAYGSNSPSIQVGPVRSLEDILNEYLELKEQSVQRNFVLSKSKSESKLKLAKSLEGTLSGISKLVGDYMHLRSQIEHETLNSDKPRYQVTRVDPGNNNDVQDRHHQPENCTINEDSLLDGISAYQEPQIRQHGDVRRNTRRPVSKAPVHYLQSPRDQVSTSTPTIMRELMSGFAETNSSMKRSRFSGNHSSVQSHHKSRQQEPQVRPRDQHQHQHQPSSPRNRATGRGMQRRRAFSVSSLTSSSPVNSNAHTQGDHVTHLHNPATNTEIGRKRGSRRKSDASAARKPNASAPGSTYPQSQSLSGNGNMNPDTDNFDRSTPTRHSNHNANASNNNNNDDDDDTNALEPDDITLSGISPLLGWNGDTSSLPPDTDPPSATRSGRKSNDTINTKNSNEASAGDADLDDLFSTIITKQSDGSVLMSPRFVSSNLASSASRPGTGAGFDHELLGDRTRNGNDSGGNEGQNGNTQDSSPRVRPKTAKVIPTSREKAKLKREARQNNNNMIDSKVKHKQKNKNKTKSKNTNNVNLNMNTISADDYEQENAINNASSNKRNNNNNNLGGAMKRTMSTTMPKSKKIKAVTPADDLPPLPNDMDVESFLDSITYT